MRGSSLESVRINYKVFHELWEEAKDIVKDSETRARIVGVQFYMKSFDYLFGMVLGEHLLKHTDNLSKTLQSPSLTASDGQHIADLTVKILQKIREEDAFDLFWQNVLLLQESTEVHGPSLPRKRRAPARFEEGSSLGYQPTTPKDFYHQQYFECLDMCISCIKDRFNQPGYAALKNLEDLLIKAANNENYNSELEFVLGFYHNDLEHTSLNPRKAEGRFIRIINLHTHTLCMGMFICAQDVVTNRLYNWGGGTKIQADGNGLVNHTCSC